MKKMKFTNKKKNARKEYINTNENSELYNKIKDVLKIKKDNLPIIVVGSTYFIGFDEKIQSNIEEAVKAYENAEKYGDIVDKVRNNEDVKDIIKQNEEIYKQPNTSNVFLNVIFVIIALFIIIFILKIVLEKKLNNTKK